MGIREWLNQHKSVGIGLGVVVLAGAGAAIFVQARDLRSSPAFGLNYYTNDDGKTFFVDAPTRLTPFDKDGKPAYRAHVFECGGQRVVGYLSRYSESAMAALLQAKEYAARGQTPPNVQDLQYIDTTGIQMKKVGTDKWLPQSDPRAAKIRLHRCLDGSTPTEVYSQ